MNAGTMDAGSSAGEAGVKTDAAVHAEAGVAPDAGADAGAGEAATPPPQHPCYGHAGSVVCEGSVMHTCSFTQVAVVRSTTCASNVQCQLGLVQGECAACRPGHFRCEGVALERCRLDGLGWEQVEKCASAPLCNESAGACTEQACVATTRKCEGPELKTCSDDLSALIPLATCSSEELCDQAGGQCDVCLANARSCAGDVSVTCRADGQSEERVQCSGVTPHCGSGGICVECLAAADCAATCRDATCNALTGRCERTLLSEGAACATGVCDATGQCVRCVQDKHCPTELSHCSAGTCVECLGNADCDGAAHEICEAGTCKVGPYCGDGIRQTGETCDGNCPTKCPAGNPADCLKVTQTGSAAACTFDCIESRILGCNPK
jgi:hypothetical protein